MFSSFIEFFQQQKNSKSTNTDFIILQSSHAQHVQFSQKNKYLILVKLYTHVRRFQSVVKEEIHNNSQQYPST